MSHNRISNYFLCTLILLGVFVCDVAAQPHIFGGLDSYPQFIPNYRGWTLNFENITANNLNQTVAEINDNEKEVEFGDYDNDGDLDVLMGIAQSDFGQRFNKLYRNDQGVLNEVSGSPMIPGFDFKDVTRAVLFRDFDADGWLDIIVINDSNSGTGNNNSPGKTKYYRNDHPNDVFSSFINESERVDEAYGAAGDGVAEDFDDNGFFDFLMCNSPNTSQDKLFFNNTLFPPGEFEDVTPTHYPAETGYGIDSEAADMNGDGQIDLLITNHFNPSFIRYNNNLNLGTGVGDFLYGGSASYTQFPETSSAGGAMQPADFNNDGRMDIYYCDKGIDGVNQYADMVFQNVGNDSFNRAIFSEIVMPDGVATDSAKVAIRDLDGDGRDDVIVMGFGRRPYIYRNTSIPEEISFVQWTPATAIPSGALMQGWHAAAADFTGDDEIDLVIGARNDDFFLKHVAPAEFLEGKLGGQLPAFHNSDPVTIIGQGARGESDTYSAKIPAGARVSVVLRSDADVSIQVRNDNGDLIAESDRGFVHVDEVAEFVASGGALEFTVSVNRVIYDGDADGDIDFVDKSLFVQCVADNDFMPDCLVFDLSNSFGVTTFDGIEFSRRMSGPGLPAPADYYLQLLSRTD